MGLGDIGTILLVAAVAWGAWTFFLSPNAETARDIGGGLFGGLTGNKEAVEKAVNKVGGKLVAGMKEIEKRCPDCASDIKAKRALSSACKTCAERNQGALQDTFRNAPTLQEQYPATRAKRIISTYGYAY